MHINGLYSKYPEYTGFPQYYQKAKGNTIWIDGRNYLDMSYSGIGSNILGYADPKVNRAVKRIINKGSMSTINCEIEEELSGRLLKSNPDFKNTRFFKTGGEAVVAALTLSGKKVLQCGYSGWHVENLNRETFEYNNIPDFMRKIGEYNPDCVITEVIRNHKPDEAFFKTIRKECDKRGIILIFDEITSGFRFRNNGYYKRLGVIPDCVIYGKAISNGYPFSCILFNNKVLQKGRDKFISSTYFTEGIGTAAALETIRQLESKDFSYLEILGIMVMDLWQFYAKRNNIDIDTNEVNQLSHFDFIGEKRLEYRTIFVNKMLEHGILGNTSFYPNFKHTLNDVSRYEEACESAFALIAEFRGNPRKIIKTSIIKDRPVVIK